MTHLSHERSEEEATAFLAAFKARTDGHAPWFTSDKLPAYVAALIANYSTPELGCRTSLSCISKWFGGFCSRLLRLRTGKLSSAFRLHGFTHIF